MTLSDIPGSPTSLPQVEGSAGGALQIWPLRGIPEVAEGADLAGHLVAALLGDGPGVCDGDVLVVSSKVVSKAMGLRAPAEHRVGLVLAESARVLAERATPAGLTRIVATHAGPVLAGAGIDGSNVGAHAAEVLLLPRDPDAAAGTLAEGVRRALADAGAPVPGRLGVLLTDTAGRPWRAGQADIAIGAAGLPVVDDLRGGHDADGRPLGVTVRAVADELAGAADLVKGKAERVPAALVRGWTWPHPVGGPHAVEGPRVTGGLSGAGGACGTGGADALVRRGGADWFALGHVEAVRAALGVSPGTHEALDIGVPAAGPEEVSIRLSRACALAPSPTVSAPSPTGTRGRTWPAPVRPWPRPGWTSSSTASSPRPPTNSPSASSSAASFPRWRPRTSPRRSPASKRPAPGTGRAASSFSPSRPADRRLPGGVPRSRATAPGGRAGVSGRTGAARAWAGPPRPSPAAAGPGSGARRTASATPPGRRRRSRRR